MEKVFINALIIRQESKDQSEIKHGKPERQAEVNPGEFDLGLVFYGFLQHKDKRQKEKDTRETHKVRISVNGQLTAYGSDHNDCTD